jgi:hypothetical protein
VLPGGFLGEKMQKRKCRICGCTDDDCRQCIEKTGMPCFWIEEDLCSACLNEAYPDESMIPAETQKAFMFLEPGVP